jgi:hypothetical protein
VGEEESESISLVSSPVVLLPENFGKYSCYFSRLLEADLSVMYTWLSCTPVTSETGSRRAIKTAGLF